MKTGEKKRRESTRGKKINEGKMCRKENKKAKKEAKAKRKKDKNKTQLLDANADSESAS